MAKLDMKHGFIKYITKNQVDRDNYDKQVRENPKAGKTHSNNKPRRPPMAIYTPPSRQEATSIQTNEGVDVEPQSQKISTHSKVNVCFIDEHEETHNFAVYKTDDPMEVAAEFCAAMNYHQMYVRPLAARIVEECNIYFKDC